MTTKLNKVLLCKYLQTWHTQSAEGKLLSLRICKYRCLLKDLAIHFCGMNYLKDKTLSSHKEYTDTKINTTKTNFNAWTPI